jgi:hypothetical protein
MDAPRTLAAFALLSLLGSSSMTAATPAAPPSKPKAVDRGAWKPYITNEYRGCKFYAPGKPNDPEPDVMDWMACAMFSTYGPLIPGTAQLRPLAIVRVAPKDTRLAWKVLAKEGGLDLTAAGKPLMGHLIIADRPKSREILAARKVSFRALLPGGRLVDPKGVKSDQGALLVTLANTGARSALMELSEAVIPFVIINTQTFGGSFLVPGDRTRVESILRFNNVIPLD